MPVDLSIVIPHRGSSLGLWATIHSAEEDLLHTKYSYNYIIVSNGDKLDKADESTIDHLERGGKLGAHIHSHEPMSPPKARQLGVEKSDARVLAFFDDHCLVSRNYFQRAMLRMESGNIDLLHSATKFHSCGVLNYHYLLTLDYNFWGKGATEPAWSMMHPIAMAGHGGFVMKRETWLEVGGYGPDDLLVGYGGEEPLFDLKMWRLGKKVHLDPLLVHYHSPANDRGYPRHFTPDYYTNMLVAANVIGGSAWMYKIFDSIVNKNHPRPVKRDGPALIDLLEIAEKRSAEYAKKIDAESVMTLDECLTYFRENVVAC